MVFAAVGSAVFFHFRFEEVAFAADESVTDLLFGVFERLVVVVVVVIDDLERSPPTDDVPADDVPLEHVGLGCVPGGPEEVDRFSECQVGGG